MADANMANFLATDKVPETIFGIPIVSREEDYTEGDIAFFKAHPEAGGYYDMGDERLDKQDSGITGAQLGGDSIRRKIGAAGKFIDRSLSKMEQIAAGLANRGVPVVGSAAIPLLVGTRAAVAHMTSGGGEYYQPEVRTERHFTNEALRAIAQSLPHAVNGAGRTETSLHYGKGNVTVPGALEASATVGGYTVRNGKVTDKFDINDSYPGIPDVVTHVAGLVLGKEKDPDAGKIRTEIPLDVLAKHQTAMGGKSKPSIGQIDAPTLSDDRPMHFFRDDRGKIVGYGTTRSMVYEGNGKFFVIPTILDDGKGGTRAASDEDAVGWYSETGEHWGSYRTPEAAQAAAQALHERHQQIYQDKWNDYIHDHWDEMSDDIRNDPDEALVHSRRTAKYPGAWNNPGNVEPGAVVYKGETGTKKVESGRTFLTFKTPKDGLNAMAQSIGQIARVKIPEEFRKGNLPNGKFTVENLVKVYAPGKDANNVKGYTDFVAGRLGISKDAPLDIIDVRQMGRLLDAMVRRDSGHPHADWFRRADYRNAARKMSLPATEKRGKKK